ncbi:MAG: flagellar hook-associated protein FlgK [Bacteroides sp.]|nr:flagellar hook-associated protein FlgK [Bacteroides sp.]
MRSTFVGYEVSKRTIQISQKSLDITNNNLSNINTEGYSRQRVDLNSTFIPLSGKYGSKLARLSLTGQGVNAFGVNQIRDKYVDKRYREFTAYVAEFDVKKSVLSEAEKILSDIDETGLIKNLNDVKTAFSKYAADSPYNLELASIVRNECYSVTQTLRDYATKLDNLKNENIIDLQESVSEVNELIDKIVTYNGVITGEYNITAADKIYYGETVIGSYGPNELLDQRNQLIDELSYYGNISVSDNNDGSVKIEMGGTTIVNGTKYEHVIMKDYEEYGAAVLQFTNGEFVSSNVLTGDLKARMDMLNGNGTYAAFYQNSEYGIPYYRSTLDAFASSFAKLMNDLCGQYSYTDKDGNKVTETDLSRTMFAADKQYDKDSNEIKDVAITASNIRISDEWMAEATMIGRNPTYDVDKDELTWDLSLDGNMVNTLYLGLDNPIKVGRAGEFTGSIYDYCLFVDDRIAESISYYEEQYDLNSDNANSILDVRQSISGVSETEEGVNMMNFQKWFNANSRMLTTMDECVDRLINNTGLAGR